jgi:two-component system sensor histidine kinase UhpB
MSLRTRLLAVNVALVCAAAGLASFSLPAAGIAVLVAAAVNWWELSRALKPLEQVTRTMAAVDLSEPGLRAPSVQGSTEVRELRAAFNRMLERLEDERRAAGRAVLRAQEAERAAIAQDLHDEVNQALTGILLRLEVLRTDAPPQLAKDLGEVKELAGVAMEELLTLARKLRPTVLGDHGLVPALQSQVQDFARRTGIDARFQRHGALPPLTEEQQLVAFRVVQESLSNIAKHAGAQTVSVDLSFTGKPVLRIADDGYGFETNGAKREGSLGLSGMKERAMLVGGRLQIFSRAGKGTTVELVFGGV